MIKGLFGELGGLVSSFAHSIVSKGQSILAGWESLREAEIDIEFDDFGLVCERYSELDTFRNAMDSIQSDRLIPASILDQRTGKSAAKFEFVVQSSYPNPEGEVEDVHMTIISDKRLTQDEILGSDLIPECAEMLALGVDEMDWEIIEGSVWSSE